MRFAVAGFLESRDGYGYGTIKIGEALRRLVGEDVELVDLRDRRGFEVPVVAACTPDWLPFISAPTVIALTMFEADRLPTGLDGRAWTETLNTYATRVVVPCRWNAEVFVENGVLRPVSVVPWGIDPADYFPLDRREHCGAYTFLWSGTPDRRKGWDVVYRVFTRTFGDRDDVRLVLHFRRLPKGLEGCWDSNVDIVEGLYDRPHLRQLLQQADCFVFPSRGEGWGLPPREAAATGLPVIATHFGGLAEDIEHWALPLQVAGTSKAEYGFWEGDLGQWVEPHRGHLAERMTWCVVNRGAAEICGQGAAAWLAREGTWERTARGILEAVTEVTRC